MIWYNRESIIINAKLYENYFKEDTFMAHVVVPIIPGGNGGTIVPTTSDYNYFFNGEKLGLIAATYSSLSGYPEPFNNTFTLCSETDGFFKSKDSLSSPTFISAGTGYGLWAHQDYYKVAENSFFFKNNADQKTPYVFVNKYSAPFIKEGRVESTAYTPFDVLLYKSYNNARFYKLFWNSSSKVITIRSYTSSGNFSKDAIDETWTQEGYGCFIMLAGGGGGGGGSDQSNWFSSQGGSGGGGGATALLYVDLYQLYKTASNGFIKITLGNRGAGGKGGAGSDDGHGTDGEPTILEYFVNMTEHNKNNAVYRINVKGGGGGGWCAWDWEVVLGAKGGEISTSGTAPAFIQSLTLINGGDGGYGSSKSKATNGNQIQNTYVTNYTIPFKFTWATYSSMATSGLDLLEIGKGTDKVDDKQGGGGGCAMGIVKSGNFYTGFGVGGRGGATNSDGEYGGYGGLAILKNYF